MNIPLVDLKRQYKIIKKNIDRSIKKVIKSGNFIMGEEIQAFEKDFSSFHNARFGISTSSGTSALFLSLKALGIGAGAGDEVITSANTFIATSEAISQVGARPVFVDIEKDSYSIDTQEIEKKINPKTRAIIVVHLYGQPADMDKINALGQKYNLKIIEDAAQAHGALYKSKKIGTLSDASCFSFFPGKNLGAYGDAGMVLTNNEGIAQKISILRNHGRCEKYEHLVEGYNERMDTLQASILRVKFNYLKQWTEKRREWASLYSDLLKNIEEVIIPQDHPSSKGVYHLYVVQVQEREKIKKYLAERGITTGIHYPIPLHLQPAYQFLGYQKGDLPITETKSKTILSLPLFPELTEKEIKFIANSIQKYFLKNK